MPHPKIKIADNSGNEVSVTDNRLDVNAAITVASDTIDIGDVEIKGHAVITNIGVNISDSSPTQLAGDSDCKHVDIMANLSNTGIIYVGASNVTVARGIALYAGDVYSTDVENVNLLYALATVDNEDLNVVYYN